MNKQSIADKINQIRNELLTLANEIKQLPENPNAERLGNNCFSLKASELGKHNRWDARYHIFSSQYEAIAQMLEEMPIETALNKFNSLIKNGSVYHRSNWITLHPQVIKNLKGLIE